MLATADKWAAELEQSNAALSNYRESVHAYYKRRNEKLKTPKVIQLDADLLDSQLGSHLKSQFNKIFSFVDSLTRDRFEPEVTAIIDLLLYWLSVRTRNQTYGQRLLGIQYRNEHNVEFEQDRPRPSSRQKALYAVFNVLGKWAMARFTLWNWAQVYDEQTPERRRVLLAVVSFMKALRLLSVLNFISFIYEGRYKTLVDRLLGLRLVRTSLAVATGGRGDQIASYEFMNKQLLWNEFGELLNFVVPFIKANTLDTWVESAFFKRQVNKELEATAGDEGMCPLCGSRPATPYVANCGHVFCYFCIQSKVMAQHWSYRCDRCQTAIKDIRPHIEMTETSYS